MLILKKIIRDLLPNKIQVPLKYYLNFIFSRLEPEMLMLSYLAKPGTNVIDVGGNRGVYAYALSKLDVVVHVYEPNPICANILKGWAKEKKNIKVYEVALSNKECSAELFIPRDSHGVVHDASGSLSRLDMESQSYTISLVTLDSLMLSNVSFIKIDVEGHELDVISGARETILRCQPTMLIEIEQRHNISLSIDKSFESIINLGYVGYFYDGVSLKSIKDFDVVLNQNIDNLGVVDSSYINNFLFLPLNRITTGDFDKLLKRFLG